MQDNPIYKKLAEAAENYTVAEAEALTITQIRAITKAPVSVTGTFVKNMRGLLVKTLQAAQDIADEERIKFILDVNFPEWRETKKGKELL